MSESFNPNAGNSNEKDTAGSEYLALLPALAEAMHLDAGASEQEVAIAYLRSLDESESGKLGEGEQGSPEELLPAEVDPEAFKAWAESASNS